jgi:hypothetical protein
MQLDIEEMVVLNVCYICHVSALHVPVPLKVFVHRLLCVRPCVIAARMKQPVSLFGVAVGLLG